MLNKTEFKVEYAKLLQAFPSHFSTPEGEELWAEEFIPKDPRLFIIMMKKLARGPKFPEFNQAIALYHAIQQGESCRSTQKVHNIPDRILDMTPEQIEADYQLQRDFLDAYPYPDYPMGATMQQCQQVDDDYNRRMRQHRLNPGEPTNSVVAIRLMADLLKKLPKSMTGRKSQDEWKETLANYNRNRDANDLEEAKKVVLSCSF